MQVSPSRFSWNLIFQAIEATGFGTDTGTVENPWVAVDSGKGRLDVAHPLPGYCSSIQGRGQKQELDYRMIRSIRPE